MIRLLILRVVGINEWEAGIMDTNKIKGLSVLLCILSLMVTSCSSDDTVDKMDIKTLITANSVITTVGDVDSRATLGKENNITPLWEVDDNIAVKVDQNEAATLTLSDGAATQN